IGPDTFGQDDNALVLIDETGVRELSRDSKLSLARKLIATIAQKISVGDQNDEN
ncbi:MAG: phosphopantothenoylcysteine decarboxylase / phosphopantothenate--cysteine ligase, partial [Comamonadaceae bacterium]